MSSSAMSSSCGREDISVARAMIPYERSRNPALTKHQRVHCQIADSARTAFPPRTRAISASL
jgi:hypothetical protein